jgi:spore coat polysaccharide biosynthesis protein SpsF
MQKPKVVAIIQARMGSTRLPGKVLLPIWGKPMLSRMLERVKQAQTLDIAVVATGDTKENDAIAVCAKENGVAVFRGSESDVLDRYYRAAKEYNADVVLRFMADCPLHDPHVIDDVVRFFLEQEEKVGNVLSGSVQNYPEGMDMDIFTFSSLEKMWKEAKLPSEREHVSVYMKNHPEFFTMIRPHFGDDDYSHLHWSVDEAGDFEFVTRVFEHFGEKMFYKDDVLQLLRKRPELVELTCGRTGYEGVQKSSDEDKNTYIKP